MVNCTYSAQAKELQREKMEEGEREERYTGQCDK